MNKREKLEAEKRTLLGKKVKYLRREGVLPANIFGKGFNSISLQLPLKEFESVYKKAGETGLVDLKVESETYPILIQNVHIHPITHTPLHADFFKVNLKEKVRATIPIIAVGEPKAVSDKVGALLQPLSEVEVESLPADLPEHIEVNVEGLVAVDENITISDLKVPTGVEILAEGTEMVFRIGELVSEEAEELAAEEEAEAAADEAKTPEEGTEEKSDEQSQEGSESPSEEKSE